MRATLSWVIAAAAALAMAGCGQAKDEVGSGGSAMAVTPIQVPPGVVLECSTPELGLPAGLVQVSIGITSESAIPPWELTYPYAIDALGSTATLGFNVARNVVDWSVAGDVVVRAVLVRAFDTGSSAYLYPAGATSDAGLQSPSTLAADDERISRVKLCFEYVEPDDGCTLTQGYWKTHSKYGPAPYDGTWGTLEDEPFYSSGKSYHQVLWTPPRGNPYFILAHQFIAAKLNGLAGASLEDVQEAFDAAAALFAASTGTAAGDRAEFVRLAGILGSYNEGYEGPGHCDK